MARQHANSHDLNTLSPRLRHQIRDWNKRGAIPDDEMLFAAIMGDLRQAKSLDHKGELPAVLAFLGQTPQAWGNSLRVAWWALHGGSRGPVQ